MIRHIYDNTYFSENIRTAFFRELNGSTNIVFSPAALPVFMAWWKNRANAVFPGKYKPSSVIVLASLGAGITSGDQEALQSYNLLINRYTTAQLTELLAIAWAVPKTSKISKAVWVSHRGNLTTYEECIQMLYAKLKLDQLIDD